jgi:hypothetical protein
VAAWLKIGYFTDSQEAAPDYWLKRAWISDSPGRSSPWWRTHSKPRKGQPYPPHGPRYEVGDRLVIYITERGVCPAILEVVAAPRWDPDWVDEKSERGEGETWGVVTGVRGISTLGLTEAPSLEEIGVSRARVQQHGHISLTDFEYEEAERLIARLGGPKPGRDKATSVQVPIEEGDVEGYEVMSRDERRRATRREAKLVRDYRAFLEARGDDVVRNKLLPPGASHALYSDLFNETRGHLVEAKAGMSRGDIRMAIGQLADYGRFVSGASKWAVLLDAKPQSDLLDLLGSQKIAAIWRNGESFTDNVGGAFT